MHTSTLLALLMPVISDKHHDLPKTFHAHADMVDTVLRGLGLELEYPVRKPTTCRVA